MPSPLPTSVHQLSFASLKNCAPPSSLMKRTLSSVETISCRESLTPATKRSSPLCCALALFLPPPPPQPPPPLTSPIIHQPTNPLIPWPLPNPAPSVGSPVGVPRSSPKSG